TPDSARPIAPRKGQRRLCLLRQEERLHHLCRASAAVSHLAVLAEQCRHTGSLAAHLRGVSWLRSGRVDSGGRNHTAFEGHPAMKETRNGSVSCYQQPEPYRGEI